MVRALFGGSFDPIHDGHVAMVEQVLGSDLTDFVHVVPAWLSPFKTGSTAAPADRLAMVQLALGEMAGVIIEPREVESGRSCYAIDTLQALQAEHPADSWVLLIGGDNLADFSCWHEAFLLQTMATVVVLGRDNIDLSVTAIRAAGLRSERFLTVPGFSVPVSSTAVRAMLALGSGDAASLAAGGIPVRVAEYIVAHQIYFPEPNGGSLVSDPD